MNIANIVLGGYINGYSIVQELSENNINKIIVVDIIKDVAAFSNKIIKFMPKTSIEEGVKKFIDWYKDYYK